MNKSISFALPAIILIAIAGVIVWPRLYRQREGVKTPPRCSSNVRQMAVALLQYQSMWDDKLPTSNWQTAITPFVRSKVLFTCSELQVQGGHDGFAMDWHLLGANLQTLKNPSKTVLVFETDALAPNVVANLAAISYSRHTNYQKRRMSWCAYADGHAKSKFEVAAP